MLTEYEIDLLKTYAECSLNLSKTGRVLHYHRNTLCYQLDKIQKKTGKNPRNMADLIDIISENKFDKIVSEFSEKVKIIIADGCNEIFGQIGEMAEQMKKEISNA